MRTRRSTHASGDSRTTTVPERTSRTIAFAVVLTLVLGFAAPARASFGGGPTNPDFIGVAADLLVMRPLGLVSLVVGSAAYVVALPFAAGSGQVAVMTETLVNQPARFTFTRKFGDI